MQVLHHFLAALLGERRHGHADQFAVVHWIEAEFRGTDRLLDRTHLRRIKRLHRDHLGLGRVHLCDLVQRHLGAVIIDIHAVQHVHRGASGARGGHRLAEIFHGFVHPCLQLYVSFFQARNRGHCGLSHISQLRKNSRIKTLNYKPK